MKLDVINHYSTLTFQKSIMALQLKTVGRGNVFHISENKVKDYKVPRINLTKREREALYFICQGLSMKEVAVKMYVSPSTVISHKRSLFCKFGVNNLVRLGVLAERYLMTNLPFQ